MHCSSFDLSLLILFSINGVVSHACWIVIRWREKMTMYASLDNLYFFKKILLFQHQAHVERGISNYPMQKETSQTPEDMKGIRTKQNACRLIDAPLFSIIYEYVLYSCIYSLCSTSSTAHRTLHHQRPDFCLQLAHFCGLLPIFRKERRCKKEKNLPLH